MIMKITKAYLRLHGGSSIDSKTSNKYVYVVHNMKNITDLEELKVLFEKRCRFYEGSEKKTFPINKQQIEYYLSEKNHTRHVCLGDENFLSYHNTLCIEALRVWMQATEDHETTNKNAIEHIKQNLYEMIGMPIGWDLKNHKLKILETTNPTSTNPTNTANAIPAEDQSSSIKRSPRLFSNSYAALRHLQLYDPSYWIEKSDQQYIINISLPGIESKDDFKISECDSEKLNCWGVALSAKIKNIPPEKIVVEDHWECGEFILQLDVPNMFSSDEINIEESGRGIWSICFKRKRRLGERENMKEEKKVSPNLE